MNKKSKSQRKKAIGSTKELKEQYAKVYCKKLEIIDGNPFVHVPSLALNKILYQANKQKGAVSIRGKVNGKPFQQTLLKYRGHWRLYVNIAMLRL